MRTRPAAPRIEKDHPWMCYVLIVMENTSPMLILLAELKEQHKIWESGDFQ